MLRFLVALATVAAVPAAVATTAPPMRRQYGGDVTNAIDAKGAPECPCVATFPANVAVAAGLLAAKGFPMGKYVSRTAVLLAARLLCTLNLAKPLASEPAR